MEAESSADGSCSRNCKKRRVETEETGDSVIQKKLTVKSRRATRGKLADLPSMPLDVLYEVFGHLKPFDLLRLARTTKDFRGLLMSRSSISVWRAARENVPGLPVTPAGMSEPAWANLAFSPHCHYCLTACVRNVEWAFRVRICSRCAKQHLGDLRDRFGLRFDPSSVHLHNLIPTRLGRRSAVIYLNADYDSIKEQYNALVNDQEKESFVRERLRIVQEMHEHGKQCEGWARNQMRGRDQELRQLREERRAAIVKKLEDLGWGEDIASIRLPDSLQAHKLVDRPQLLTERIWANIKPGLLVFMEEMRKKRVRRDYEELVMKRKKVAMQVLRDYKASRISGREIMPEGPDFCDFPIIKEALYQPSEVNVDVTTFEDIIPKLPGCVVELRQNINLSIVGTLRTNLTAKSKLSFRHDEVSEEYAYMETPERTSFAEASDEELSRRLDLASNVFNCQDCGRSGIYSIYDLDDSFASTKLFFYPQVLGHSCATRHSEPFYYFDTHSSTEVADPSKKLHPNTFQQRKKWSNSFSFDSAASKIVEQVVLLAGLNPGSTTTHEMDQADHRFACLVCSVEYKDGAGGSGDYETRPRTYNNTTILKANSAAPLFGWRGAVRHQMALHPGFAAAAASQLYKTISPEVLSEGMREAERNHFDQAFQWICVHCLDTTSEARPSNLSGIKQHITARHEIASPKLNEDFREHFAALDICANHSPFFVHYNDAGQYLPYRGPPISLYDPEYPSSYDDY